MNFIDQKLYSKIHEAMPIACVDLVIMRDDRALLIRRKIEPDLGRFWIPGGRLRKLESLHSAAIRIAREELGISINIGRFVGYTDLIFPADPFGHGKKTHTVSFVFACNPTSTDIQLDKNHSAVLWWDGEEVYADIPTTVRCLVRRALGRVKK